MFKYEKEYYIKESKRVISEQLYGISWKFWLISSLIVVAIIVAYYIYKKSDINNQTKRIQIKDHIDSYISIKTIVGIILLTFYMGFIFQITFFNRSVGHQTGFKLSLEILNIFKIPFWWMIYNYLNVALFVPIGIFLNIIIRRYTIKKRFLTSLLVGFLTSTCIEITQLITKRGLFELADIITNTIGAILGFLISLLFIRRKALNDNKTQS